MFEVVYSGKKPKTTSKEESERSSDKVCLAKFRLLQNKAGMILDNGLRQLNRIENDHGTRITNTGFSKRIGSG